MDAIEENNEGEVIRLLEINIGPRAVKKNLGHFSIVTANTLGELPIFGNDGSLNKLVGSYLEEPFNINKRYEFRRLTLLERGIELDFVNMVKILLHHWKFKMPTINSSS